MAESLPAWLASRGLRVEEREGRGRCLVAARPFAPGDLLLEQAPYAAVLLDDAPACDACGRVAQGGAAELKRCTRCRAVRYCGAECQVRARATRSACSSCLMPPRIALAA
jgi:hypothetical protein